MSGYRRGGAQAVFLAGSAANVLNQQSGTLNTSSLFRPIGDHISNSSLSSAVTLTPQTDANAVMIGVEDQSVRVRMDGNDADSSTGFLYLSGDIFILQFTSGVTISVIETAATATIQYQWGRI